MKFFKMKFAKNFKPISDELQQKLAIEMNLSETAFILEKDGNFKTGIQISKILFGIL